MDKVKIAIVGCGGMAGAHLNGYTVLRRVGIKDFEIVATCDVAEEKLDPSLKGSRDSKEANLGFIGNWAISSNPKR